MKCFLSGLEIPVGHLSVEHIVPRFWLPSRFYNLKENKAPAIKIINNVKGIHMPCEWFDMRYELTYHAYQNWRIKNAERTILKSALTQFNKKNEINPCEYCILSKVAQEYCIGREELEKYRRRWLYELKR